MLYEHLEHDKLTFFQTHASLLEEEIHWNLSLAKGGTSLIPEEHVL
jgi:hypothetical protein